MKRLGFIFALLFAFTSAAKADSITMASHTGNSYVYNLNLDSNVNVFILDGFSLNGLSGVTDAYLSSTLDNIFDVWYDASNVYVGTIAGISANWHAPYTIGSLTLISTSAPGPVNFTIVDSNGIFRGSVTGPDVAVAATPEPSSLMLLGTGLLGVAGLARRKFLAAA